MFLDVFFLERSFRSFSCNLFFQSTLPPGQGLMQDLGSKAASKATEASREAASKAKEAKVGVDRLVGVYQGVVVVYKEKVVPTGVITNDHFFFGERSKKLQICMVNLEGFFVDKKFGLVIQCHGPCGERKHLEQGNNPLRKIMMFDRNF